MTIESHSDHAPPLDADAADGLAKAVTQLLSVAGDIAKELATAVPMGYQGQTTSTDGRYLLLTVPNYNAVPLDASSGSAEADRVERPERAPRGSYLRLGAVPTDLRAGIGEYVAQTMQGDEPPPPDEFFDKASGEDLALRVLSFNDDVLERCAEPNDPEQPGSFPDYSYNYKTPTERAEQTAWLHLRGGWREHTDGNRISTTRGDKVEVIGGNYKLLVMCRDADGNSDSGWDVSGGHVGGATGTRGRRARRAGAAHASEQLDGSAVASESAIRWQRASAGSWHSDETATRGDTCSLQCGDSENVIYGHRQLSSVGSESPTPWCEPEDERDPDAMPNPRIVDRTWAEGIHSYTGSAGWRVPQIEDETHVIEMASVTRAQSMRDTTHGRDMTTVTTMGRMQDDTHCDGTMHTSVTALTKTDVMSCDLMTSTTLANTFELTTGNALSLTAGATNNTMLGGSTEVMIGGRADVTLGASVSLTASLSMEIMLGIESSYNAGAQVSLSLLGKMDTAATGKSQLAATLSRRALLIMLGIP